MAFASLPRRFSAWVSSKGKARHRDDHNAIQLLAKSAIATVRKPEDSKPSRKWTRRFHLWLKTFGLGIFRAWKSEEEPPKIAIQQDRTAAALRCLIHLIPVSGVLILLFLNVSGTFIGTNLWSQSTTALQFVAKLHEMFIASSLAVIVASYTHHYLTSDRGLPFGASLATTQVFQLNYLISPELLGAVRARSYSRTFKLHLLPVLVLFPLLISTVGPASAACMIPRLGPWRLNSAIFGFKKSWAEFFPVRLDLSSPAATSWNVTGMDSSYRLMPLFDGFGVPTQNKNTSLLWSVNNVSVPMTLYVQTEGPFNETSSPVYEATTAIQNIALGSIFASTGLPWTLDGSMDAFSNVSCPEANKVTWRVSNDSLPPPSFVFNTPTNGIATQHLDEFDLFNIRASLDQLPSNATDVVGETVRFFDLPETNATGIVYFTADVDLLNNTSITLHPCTATLGWYPANLYNTGQVFQSRSLPNLERYVPGIRPTQISITSIREMPLLPSSTNSDYSNNLLSPYMIPSVMPLALSVMLTVTLSTASGTISSSGSAICNTKTGFCGGFQTTFKTASFRYGYGYGTEIASVRISLAVLMLYCLIAALHTGFTIYTGRTSTAWDSMSELVALAMGSRRPVELDNSSAGIERAHVFEHRVRIAATAGVETVHNGASSRGFEPTGKHLELIFPSTEIAVLSKVRPNTEYAG